MSPRQTLIQPASRVRLHLSIHAEDGTEVLSTFGESPIECTLGDVTPAGGLEELLVGHSEDSDLQLRVPGERIYGAPDPARVHWLPRGDFRLVEQLEVGQVIAFDPGTGEEALGRLLAVEPDRVRVDFNHPLASGDLELHVRILPVSPVSG